MRRGRSALTVRASSGTPTAYGLLGAPSSCGHDLEVYVPPSLLADLHAPDLVITPRYVGPERRLWSRLPVGAAPSPPDDRRSLRLMEAVVIVLVSVALAVPLTLLASHQIARAVPAAPAARPAADAAVPAARSAAQQAALARHQAALARREATAGARQAASAQRRTARTARQAARLEAATAARAQRATATASRRAAAEQRAVVRSEQQAARSASRAALVARSGASHAAPATSGPTST